MQTFLNTIKEVLQDIEATAEFVPNKIHTEISLLKSQLDNNAGIMPPSWLPYANLLIAILTVVELFVNAETKIIIAEIIAAIKAAETV